MSGASERANGRASDPVLLSGFLVIPAHSAVVHSAIIWIILLLFLIPRSKPVFCKHRFENLPKRVSAIDGDFEIFLVSGFR